MDPVIVAGEDDSLALNILSTGNPTPSHHWTVNGYSFVFPPTYSYAPRVRTSDDGTQISVAATNSAGSVTTPTTTLRVIPKKWYAVERVESSNNSDMFTPRVAFGYNGDAIAVWQEMTGTGSTVWARHYTVNSGWGTATAIASDSNLLHRPHIALDLHGNAVAAWMHGDSGSISATIFTAGSGWGAPVQVVSSSPHSYADLQLAVSVTGSATLAWHEPVLAPAPTFASNGVFASTSSTSTPSGTWTAPQRLDTSSTAGAIVGLKLAAGSISVVHAVWTTTDAAGNRNAIWAVIKAGTGWTSPEKIEASPAGGSSSPMDLSPNELCIAANGQATAIWSRYTNGTYTLFANHYTSGPGWGVPMAIADLGPSSFSHYPSYRIACQPNGNAIAVWNKIDEQSAENWVRIWAGRYVSGQGWEQPTLLSKGMEVDAGDPYVGVDINGNAIAMWNLWSSRYMANVGWSMPREPLKDASQGIEAPLDFASDGDGNALVLWTGWDYALAQPRRSLWSLKLK